jgi:hypothetical protein
LALTLEQWNGPDFTGKLNAIIADAEAAIVKAQQIKASGDASFGPALTTLSSGGGTPSIVGGFGLQTTGATAFARTSTLITQKTYFEAVPSPLADASNTCIAVIAQGQAMPTANQYSNAGVWLAVGDRRKSGNGASLVTVGGAGSNIGAGQALQLAVDPVAGKIWFGFNGTWVGDPAAGTGEAFSGLPAALFAMVIVYGANSKMTLNLGGPFAHTPPAGFA